MLLPGIRLDYFSEVSQFTAAPRFTARFDMTKQLVLKGGVGLFYQQPTIDQADEVFGSTNLKCMRAIHYSAGAEWKPFKYITFDLTGFYKDLSSMVSPNPAFGGRRLRPALRQQRYRAGPTGSSSWPSTT